MIVVSSCLAGVSCRYDGNSNSDPYCSDLVEKGKAIPLCPEMLGGLTTPREPVEIVDGKVLDKDGNDFTREFNLGAKKVLEVCEVLGVEKVYLKSKSPSCGKGLIYDGSFSNNLVTGVGVTANLLLKSGIEVVSVD